ncbi:chaperone protein dnaJ 6-like isoform X2 [Rhododendron vialii]|uniref:chaperone protein dnaJ 6-like isoform X2 n=1 Tax=Rhododendron vialii TaxID=182163 RepID=UPI00265DDA27|nr:chaperone protein dnaJ 6-like isoform X2 [Rhododendron vialii]
MESYLRGPCRSFFRTMYRKITEADIEEFGANYRGFDSEKNDLIDLYKKYKGNLNRYDLAIVWRSTYSFRRPIYVSK